VGLKQIKGIGDATIKKLRQANINSVADLVETFPVKYLEKRISSFQEAKLGVEITLEGIVRTDANVFFIRRRLNKLTFSINVGNVVFNVAIFNREFLVGNLKKGAEAVITGKFTTSLNSFSATDVVMKKYFREGIIPVYAVPGLSSRQYHKLVTAALSDYLPTVKEDLPEELIAKNKLLDKRAFLKIVHQPATLDDTLRAAERIKYCEFLDFALKVEGYRALNQRVVKTPKKYDIVRVREFIGQLPFNLTDDQKQATNEIFVDLKSNHPMNRLLQGEVGSGKTIIAILAMLAVCTAKEQVAVMAPTEILAWQNFRVIERYLKPWGINIAILTGSSKKNERKSILNQLAIGKIDILIGTHALIQDDLDFYRLGLVIIDEQHRFGVRQRQILRQKGQSPDVLLMTATPIPRTLAITLFRDMDISTVRTLPTGRKPILTEIVEYTDLSRVFSITLEEVKKGRQAYFIVPLISGNEQSSQISLAEFKEEIEKSVLGGCAIGYLHGQQKNFEKQSVLERFYRNETPILVSTTVVEVGVNVPNATIMAILCANSFGLSQLHQLRGRIGRGNEQGRCFLIVDSDPENRTKLEILETETDGFAISLADLRLRGPGEVFGDEQTGIMRFRMGNLILDDQIFERAIHDARWLLESTDPLAIKLVRGCFKKIDTYILD
jgi:ATP-dependent DNA helicase RecG